MNNQCSPYSSKPKLNLTVISGSVTTSEILFVSTVPSEQKKVWTSRHNGESEQNLLSIHWCINKQILLTFPGFHTSKVCTSGPV